MLEETPRTEDELLDECQQAYEEITGDRSQRISRGQYTECMCGDDPKRRRCEARIYYRGKGRLMLVANLGDPRGLLDLREKFKAKGINAFAICTPNIMTDRLGLTQEDFAKFDDSDEVREL